MKPVDAEVNGRCWFGNSRLPQYVAAIAATLMAFCGGTSIAWTSPSAPLLQAEGLLSETQVSWLGSLLSLGAVLGAPPAGLLLQRRGRRGTLLLLGVPFLLSYTMLLVFRARPGLLYVARLLAGVSLGGLCVATPVYIAEVAEDSVRGQLGSFFQMMFSCGILFVHLLGLAGNYFLLGVGCLLTSLLSMAVLYWMPETPHHHLARSRKHEAMCALQWLRGGRRDVSEELRALQVHVDEASHVAGTWRDLVFDHVARKALAISLGLLAFQQLSGICAVLYFTETIFEEAGGLVAPATSSVVVGAVMLAAAYVGSLLVDRLGRRFLLMFSSCVLVLSLTVLGGYFYVKELALLRPEYTWVPLASAVLYVVAYSVSLGPLPWTVMAELLPPNVKGLGGSLASSFCWLLSFVVAKTFQDMKEVLGMYFAFWCFSFFCFVAVPFVHFFVPETKGKSLHQIQEELGRGRRGISRSGVISSGL